MEINFYYRPLSKTERSKQEKLQDTKDISRPIYMYVSLYGDREPYNIKFKCKESLWDIKQQVVSLKKGKEFAVLSNLMLQEWKQKAIDLEEKYKPNNLILLFRLLDGIEIQEQTLEDEKEFFKFFKNYMDSSVPAGSIHNYRKCLVHLTSFSNHRYKITWETLTQKFYQDFIKYLSEEYTNFRTGKEGILNSTMTKDIWTLKDVCKYARKQGIVVPVDVEDFAKPSNSETQRQKITEERLNDLIKFDFTDWTLYSKHLRMQKIIETKIIPNILKVRDIYTFSFYTGLAHKEVMKITKNSIVKEMLGQKEISVIDFTRSKTKRHNAIPLNKVCLNIIEKYKGGKALLPYFTNQQYNRICKSMFNHAGFNKKVTLTRWSGNREITETFEEWQLLTSHTGRHSAATNILKKTGDLTIARDMLGHKSIKTTEIYAKNDRETLNEKILKVIDPT
jgi:site-specific recombinase XerD